MVGVGEVLPDSLAPRQQSSVRLLSEKSHGCEGVDHLWRQVGVKFENIIESIVQS